MSKSGASPQQSWGDGMFKFAKRRRQPRWVRVLIAVLIACCIYLVGINALNPPTANQPIAVSDSGPAGGRSNVAPIDTTDSTVPRKGGAKVPQKPLGGDTSSPRSGAATQGDRKLRSRPTGDEGERPARRTKQRVIDDEEDDGTRRSTPAKGYRGLDDEEGDEEKEAWMQKLESDLKHIFTITPDELHVRELLRPIENSGKERLREIGLRARAFRTLFEAWEDVHLVHTKNTTMVRDDVITYLRKAKDLRGIDSHKPRAEIIRSYESFRYFLTKLSALLFPWTAPYFADHMTLHASIRHGGRGIVLSGGDGQLTYLLTSARAIRKLGCNLPIEVMYLGDDDLGDDSRSELEMVPGVITRDMKQMVHDQGWDLKGWAGKPFAILLSSFREAIFIDADAQFFKSPEVLFNDEAYEETGALFFRDRLMFPESKRKWLQQILPKPMSTRVRKSRFWTGESGHMQESGVVVVDKWQHFMALLMVTRMNGPDRDGDKDKGIVGTYDMVYGDKETFWLGWELVGDSEYAFHPGDAGNMGVAKPKTEASEKERKRKEEEAKRKEEEEEAAKKKREEEEAKKKKEDEEAAKKKDEDTKKQEEETKKRNEEEFKKRIEQVKLQAEEQHRKDEAAARQKVEEQQKERINAAKAAEMIAKVKEEKGPPQPAAPAPAPAPGAAAPATPDPNVASTNKEESGQDVLLSAVEKLDAASKEAAKPQDAQVEKRDAEAEPVQVEHIAAPPPSQTRLRKRAVEPEAAEEEGEAEEADEDELPSLDSPRTNYTICAPQLLHLGRDGRPLWFNGWILDNKFDADHASLSKFEHYMKENRAGSKEADWKLESNNMCCLENDRLYEFNDEEKTVIKNIFAIATDLGVLEKH